MGKIMITDCTKCGVRFDWDVTEDLQLCPRCKTLQSNDIPSILKEMKKHRVPGQEPILRMIEVLFEKITILEKISHVAPPNTQSHEKA